MLPPPSTGSTSPAPRGPTPLGLAFRALGHGLKVGVVQFIKGKWKTGERLFAEALPMLIFRVMGRGFTWESDDLSRDKEAAAKAWQEAAQLIRGGEHAIVVLDELTYVINYDFVPLGAERSSLKAVVEAVARERGMRVSPDARELVMGESDTHGESS
jgi:cob(I)alamin adenosyltransferase